ADATLLPVSQAPPLRSPTGRLRPPQAARRSRGTSSSSAAARSTCLSPTRYASVPCEVAGDRSFDPAARSSGGLWCVLEPRRSVIPATVDEHSHGGSKQEEEEAYEERIVEHRCGRGRGGAAVGGTSRGTAIPRRPAGVREAAEYL